MLYIYRTNFTLNNDVSDFEEAKKYLIEDDMTKYLKDDLDNENYSGDFEVDGIQSIEWVLTKPSSGYVELVSEVKLSEHELEYISEWVSGQNSDGLGESFEQQDFACTREVDRWSGETFEYTSSFNWNEDYSFELVEA